MLNGHQFAMSIDIGEYCIDDTYAVKLVDPEMIINAHRLANRIILKLHLRREEASQNERDACIECRKKVTNEDMAISCDGCLKWQHIICNDIASDEDYHKYLDSRAILLWKCRRCQVPLTPQQHK